MEAIVLSGAPVYVDHDLPRVEAIGIAGGRITAAGSLRELSAALPSRRPDNCGRAGARSCPRSSMLTSMPSWWRLTHTPTCGAVPPAPSRRCSCGWARWSPRAHHVRPAMAAIPRLPAARPGRAAQSDGGRARLRVRRPADARAQSDLSRVGGQRCRPPALRIGRPTPDPPGGRIMRDRRGRPTGVLLEAASFAAEAMSQFPQRWHPRWWRYSPRRASPPTPC